MSTVTTPSGHVLEGVSGSELAYYKGEANTVGGYVIDEEPAVTFPRVFDGEKYVGEESADELGALADSAGDAAVASQHLADATSALAGVTLPEGQYLANDGIVYDASGTAVDPQPEPQTPTA